MAVDNVEVNLTIYNLYFEPEVVTVPNISVKVAADENVVLTCDIEAFPLPTFQWQKIIDLSFQDLEGENKSQYLLPNVSLSDSGMYRCIASNTINGSTRTTEQQFDLNGMYIKDTYVHTFGST